VRKGRGVACQVSFFPLTAENYDEAVKSLLRDFDPGPLTMRVGEMSTLLQGEPQDLWPRLRRLYELAEAQGGPFALDICVSNHSS